MLEGIDVSVYQLTTPKLDGLGFLLARATYGTSLDRMAAKHIAAAKGAGLVTGLYHFGRHGGIPDQLDAFSGVVARLQPDLVVLDRESDGSNPIMTIAEAKEFVAGIQAVRPCGLYASTSTYIDVGQAWRWVADYRGQYASSGPPIPWHVWQYTSTPIDHDRFNGSADQLRRLGMLNVATVTLKPWAAPRTVAAPVTTLYLPDGSKQIVSNLATMADSDAEIEQLDGRAPHGTGWIRLSARPFAGWYAVRASVVLGPAAPDPVKAERDRVKALAVSAIQAIQ